MPNGSAQLPATGMRPLAPVPLSAGGVLLEIASVLMIAATFGALILTWNRLPPTVPIHFNFSGKPDAWGSRAVLWIMPAMAAALYGTLTWGARVPQKFLSVKISPRNSQAQYAIAVAMIRWMKAVVAAMILVLTLQGVRVSLGTIDSIGRWPSIGGTACILCVLGFYLPKLIRAK